MLTNQQIESAINENRGPTVLAEIEYRKMRALEQIAGLLAKLASPPLMVEGPLPLPLHPQPPSHEIKGTALGDKFEEHLRRSKRVILRPLTTDDTENAG